MDLEREIYGIKQAAVGDPATRGAKLWTRGMRAISRADLPTRAGRAISKVPILRTLARGAVKLPLAPILIPAAIGGAVLRGGAKAGKVMGAPILAQAGRAPGAAVGAGMVGGLTLATTGGAGQDAPSTKKQFTQQMVAQMAQRPAPAYVPQMTRYASSIYSKEDLQRAVEIAASLEKTARVGARLASAVSPTARPWSEYAKWAVGMTGLGAAAGLGMEGAVAGTTKIKEKMRLAGRNKQYRGMLKADPTLKHYPDAKTYFNVLHRSSPFIASEPIIAAGVVRSMVEAPALDERKVKQILDTETAYQRASRPDIRVPSGIIGKGPSYD